MFERFSDAARRALFFARYETTELGGTAIEPEHMLLGLLRADKGPTLGLFAAADLTYSEALNEIRANWGVRDRVPTSVEVPFSDETERILQYATEEADRAGQTTIDTAHLLLGVFRADASVAAAMLRRHGMTLEGLREHVVKLPEAPSEPPPRGVSVRIRPGAFDAVEAVERIRVLSEELGQSQAHGDTRRLLDEIHGHLDALKRHLA